MNVELLEGENICPQCNGSGIDERGIWICDKCDGEKKVDWVSRATTKSLEGRMSSLRLVRVRQIISHIKETVAGYMFESRQVLQQDLNKYLEDLRQNHAIYEYTVICDDTNFHNFDIFIQPTKTVEQVRLSLKIEK